MNWEADFAGLPPIELPDGSKLKTLSDLRGYILALPKSEQAKHWMPVAAELFKAAEYGGPFLITARSIFSRALHGVEGVGPPRTPRDLAATWKEKRARRPIPTPRDKKR